MGITENITTNICEMNEVAAGEVRGVSHFFKNFERCRVDSTGRDTVNRLVQRGKKARCSAQPPSKRSLIISDTVRTVSSHRHC
jgi:hypothetical protein